MEKEYTVYKHTAPNGKVYIGITKAEPSKRWKNGNGYKTQVLFYKAIEKYGWNNFKHEILFSNLTKEEAEQREIDLIKQYKSNNPEYGYNIREGGSLSLWAESSKEKLRLANLGKHLTAETKKKLHDFNIGKKIPEEVKSKISKTLTGFKRGTFSEEHRKKLSESLKGRPPSEKQLKQLLNLAENQKGRNNPNARRVKQFDLKNNYIKTWDCISDACKKLGVNTQNSGNISMCCKGTKKTAYGYIWRYVDDN
jgi:group I intron endonuclease